MPAPTRYSPFFSSFRERRLWAWTFAVLVAIWGSMPVTPFVVAALGQEIVAAVFLFGMFLVAAAIFVQALVRRPGGREIGVWVGAAAAYWMVMLRMAIPAERSHLIEYSVFALLVHEALKERAGQGRRVPVPWLLAVAGTALVGMIDESVQGLVPGRVFDPIDMLFNALAGVMAVTANGALGWARRVAQKRRRR